MSDAERNTLIVRVRHLMDVRHAAKGFNSVQDYCDVADELGITTRQVEFWNHRPDPNEYRGPFYGTRIN